MSNQRNGTRDLYKRNRYYDPTSGRFTQEDPIGLAGGLNLYGFAGGDPVNFSDPFGLFPCCLTAPGIGQFISETILLREVLPGMVDEFDGAVRDLGSLIAVGFGLQGLVETSVGVGTAATTVRAAEDRAGAAVYRRYGGEARAVGSSWTTAPPASVASFRVSAGLPASNANNMEIGGMLRDATAVRSRAALRGAGGRGGIEELLIPNAEKQVRVDYVRPVKQ